jgi:hypothetical protein
MDENHSSLGAASIWAPHEAFYLQSMLFNSRSAVRSIGRLNDVFDGLPAEPSAEDIERLPARQILDELQNLVLQGAAISRYFWPVRKDQMHILRSEALRQAFAITEASPLFSRDLRNALEHFDERLDRYLTAGVVGYVFPEFVGPKPVEDGVPGHFFRAYFVDRAVFRLLGEEFLIEPLAKEVLSIHDMLVAMDANGGRLRRNKPGAGNQGAR